MKLRYFSTIRNLLFVFLILINSGCAAIISGSSLHLKSKITLKDLPEGSIVEYDKEIFTYSEQITVSKKNIHFDPGDELEATTIIN